jgi:ribosomal 50S subunit-associated protein YjgA (DUF615 family)
LRDKKFGLGKKVDKKETEIPRIKRKKTGKRQIKFVAVKLRDEKE